MKKNENSPLEEKNKHERDGRIVFDEEPHIYYVDGDSNYQSVTTFIKSFFECFDADDIIGKMKNGPNWSKSKYYGKSDDEIKEEWKENGKKASEEGTFMHKQIENFFNGIMPSEEYQETSEWKLFMDFRKDHPDIEPYRLEWEIFDEKHRLAGSVDGVFVLKDTECIDGKVEVIVIDWKRSSNISFGSYGKWKDKYGKYPVDNVLDVNGYHYFLQLELYKYILQEYYDVIVSNMYIVRIHPNAKKYEKIEAYGCANEINRMLDYRFRQLQE